MSIVTYNNRSIANISAIPGAAKSLIHIKTLTASSSSTLSFVDGSDDVVLDSTYPIYKFEFINIHGATDGAQFNVGFRDGDTNYDATKTSTFFKSQNREDGAGGSIGYETSHDLAQGTGFQNLTQDIGNDNDQGISGELFIFNPSSTTFVKHFIAKSNSSASNDRSFNDFIAGYCNVTAAIDAVQFKMSSGNIDSGTIKLYGLKDS